LDLATSGKGGVGPYIGICAIVGSFGVADAHVQGGMVGDLSFMHPELIQVFSAQGSYNFQSVFVLLAYQLAFLIHTVTMFYSPFLLARLHQEL
jgi:hypothetical protein